MLTFYYSPGSCALATHIALIDAGAEYKAVRLNFAKEEQRQADYLAINPKARVPSLVTKHGVITETPALLAFVAQSYPKARLAPLDDPFAFARVQEFNCYLCATAHVAHAHKSRGYRWVDPADTGAIAAIQRKVPETMTQIFDLIETRMLQGPFVMGEAYTICDPYLFTLSGWLKGDSVDIDRFPKVHAHRDRMSERASVKRAIAEESEAMAA